MNSRGLSFLATTTSRHVTSAAPSPLKTHFDPHHFPRRATTTAKTEIRVCTNRTCRRQGSTQTLEVLTGVAPPDVSVVSCGCLGRCGAGPNIVILPDAVFVSHCGTAARSAEVMMKVCGVSGADGGRSLKAFGLRKRAEEEFGVRNLSQAEILISEALELEAFGGVHVCYKVRSTVRLASGNYLGALEDAKEALRLAPLYVEVVLGFFLVHSISRGMIRVPIYVDCKLKSNIENFITYGGHASVTLSEACIPNSDIILYENSEPILIHWSSTNNRAYICQGDALLAMDQFDAADKSYTTALEVDPTIRRSKSFKAQVSKLQEKIASVRI